MSIRGFRVSSGGLPALLVTTALCAGFAASAAAARPPISHSTARPPVDFYWRLNVTPTAVQADGLVERRNHLIAGAWLQLLGLDATGRIDRYHAGPYGLPDERTLEAIRLAARLEGMLTDPVYEGKSMAGLIDLVSRVEIEKRATVLYAHLGGQPALNAYSALFR